MPLPPPLPSLRLHRRASSSKQRTTFFHGNLHLLALLLRLPSAFSWLRKVGVQMLPRGPPPPEWQERQQAASTCLAIARAAVAAVAAAAADAAVVFAADFAVVHTCWLLLLASQNGKISMNCCCSCCLNLLPSIVVRTWLVQYKTRPGACFRRFRACERCASSRDHSSAQAVYIAN